MTSPESTAIQVCRLENWFHCRFVGKRVGSKQMGHIEPTHGMARRMFNRYFVWHAQEILHLAKSGLNSSCKHAGRRGIFEGDLQRGMSRGRPSTKDTLVKHVRTSGSRLPERGCVLEHQILRFAEMTLRDRCPGFTFRGMHSTSDRWGGKTAKCIGMRPSALHSSQGCFVFDFSTSNELLGKSYKIL